MFGSKESKFGDNRKAMLEDMAILLGGRVVGGEGGGVGIGLEEVILEAARA